MGGRSAGLPLILRDVGKRCPSIDLSLGGRSHYPESVALLELASVLVHCGSGVFLYFN